MGYEIGLLPSSYSVGILTIGCRAMIGRCTTCQVHALSRHNSSRFVLAQEPRCLLLSYGPLLARRVKSVVRWVRQRGIQIDVRVLLLHLLRFLIGVRRLHPLEHSLLVQGSTARVVAEVLVAALVDRVCHARWAERTRFCHVFSDATRDAGLNVAERLLVRLLILLLGYEVT